MPNILYINHKQKSCGVYQIGRRIGGFLADSNRYRFLYREVQSAEEIVGAINETQPIAVVYNFFPTTMPMVVPEFTQYIRGHGIKQFGIIHDPMELDFLRFVEQLFDFWIVHDETNPIISYKKFTACRPVPRFPAAPTPERFSVGSHGFGVSPWKAFDTIVAAVNREFDEADINFNIGAAAFGDQDGAIAKRWREKCQAEVTKPGIRLNITGDFLAEESDVVGFLQRNTLNIYFHRDPPTIAGPAGSADLAIASQRALVVNDCYMYRHLWSQIGAYGPNAPLRVLADNAAMIDKLYRLWTPERMVSDYERMLDFVFRPDQVQ